MRWEMEMVEVEAVLERIWDLHDKISDAIHAISRAHFLRSIQSLGKPKPSSFKVHPEPEVVGDGGRSGGFVFVKDSTAAEAEEDDLAAMAEAKSLNAIRSALENLEDQLEFFHTLQSQQRAEQGAALARLEQSRIILARRLADHRGKKYKVIEEALAFVGDVPDTAGRFVAPESLFQRRSQSDGDFVNMKGERSVLMQMLMSGLASVRRSLKLEGNGSILGNCALFAISMLAILRLRQAVFVGRNEKDVNRMEITFQSSEMNQFDVLSARG